MRNDQAFASVAQVVRSIAPEADLAGVPGSARLRDALDLDSIDFLGVVQGVHDLTGVDIPESAYDEVGTLDGLVAYVAAHAA